VRRPRLWPWAVTLAAGVALFAAGIGVFASTTILGLLDHQVRITPYHAAPRLDVGTYYVFEAQAGATVTSPQGAPQLSPSDVTVTAPDGSRLSTYVPGTSETLTSNGASFLSVVGFTTTVAGRYLIHVGSPSGIQVDAFVAPSITTAVRQGVGWLLLSALGGLVALVGLIVLIAQLVRRSRLRRAPLAAPRCANGHPAGAADRFCATCGAPVLAGAPAHPGAPMAGRP